MARPPSFSFTDDSSRLSNALLTVDRPQATKDTVNLGPPHEPKEESIKVFKEIVHDLKKQLVHLRHDHDSKCPCPPNLLSLFTPLLAF